MKLKDIYLSEKNVISYEIFPPKAELENYQQKLNELFNELKELKEFNPAFISVTYGAGGSTRENTLDIVKKIKKELNIVPMPHFTCVGSSRNEISEYLNLIQSNDIKNILALRGDPPKGEINFLKPVDGFGYANELVEFIKEKTDLGIAVAGYPECHLECENFEKDIENLKRKLDAGAEVIITQLFYENDHYYKYMEALHRKGINIPVIPGILPIVSYKQIQKISSLCNCSLPKKLSDLLEKNKDNTDAIKQIGIDFATEQSHDLFSKKVSGVHFYTLNKAYSTKKIIQNLNSMV